jgi:hypothetical protein
MKASPVKTKTFTVPSEMDIHAAKVHARRAAMRRAAQATGRALGTSVTPVVLAGLCLFWAVVSVGQLAWEALKAIGRGARWVWGRIRRRRVRINIDGPVVGPPAEEIGRALDELRRKGDGREDQETDRGQDAC